VGYNLMAAPFNLSLAEGFAANCRFDEGLGLIDDALRQVETNGDFIYMQKCCGSKALTCSQFHSLGH
jgi:hypothetical protein